MKTRIYGWLITVLFFVEGGIAQWVQQNSGTTQKLTDVVMLDSTTAIAVGRDRAILRTTNAGTTWVNGVGHLSFTVPWNGVSFFDTTYGIVVGDNGVVFTTTNGGKGWSSYHIPKGQKCLSALYVGASNIYVGADSGWVYHSLDTGKTWASEKISLWPIRSLFARKGIDPLGGFPIFALTPFSLCKKWEYPSSPWHETILKNFEGLGSEAYGGEFCKGGGVGFIVGVQGDLRAAPTIIRTKGSDTIWTGVSQGILHDGVFTGISAPSTNIIYVCGDGGMLFKSTNGGDTWNSSTGVTSRSLKAISFFDVNHGFAVGDSGTILHTNNGVGVVVDVGKEPGPAPKEFLLDQNYPNPFNPTTTIKFGLPEPSYVTLRIYNIVGREVALLINGQLGPGYYHHEWNAAGMASGVYLCRIEATSAGEGSRHTFSQVNKLLLIK